MENFNEKLIEMVHINPCLYDKRNLKYKDVKHKERVWEEISKEVNLSVKECKVKWKSLRDKYRKVKVSEDLPSGSGQKIGAPWKYMASMEFLAESMEPASTIGNTSEDLSDNWLEDENTSQSSHTTTSRKRPKEDLFTEVLSAMKRKYEEPISPNTSKDTYENFFGMLRSKFDKLPESEVDDLQIDILNLVNRKIKASKP